MWGIGSYGDKVVSLMIVMKLVIVMKLMMIMMFADDADCDDYGDDVMGGLSHGKTVSKEIK